MVGMVDGGYIVYGGYGSWWLYSVWWVCTNIIEHYISSSLHFFKILELHFFY
jgi:hypothetical protein